MNLQQIRQDIDSIDTQLVNLFRQRLEKAASVAEYKKQNSMSIYDPARERALLERVSDLAGEEHEANTRLIFSLLMDLSKSYQAKLLLPESKYEKIITSALEETSPLFPERATVACQGTEGAYAQVACNKLFALPNIMYNNSFEGVFNAVESGLCKYGVLPIENSTAGSVNSIYD
ncbi:MAG: chorismate mutase, partial [Clostridia bacterium]|nr:chorismate mutase [Clostridia bacterium]